jgi:hypothetical protein
MYNTRDTAIIFAAISLFHLLGGAALGAGLAARRWLLVAWGLLIGAGPLYLGIERALKLDSWLPLAWQLAVLAACALATGLPTTSRLRAFLLRPGMTGLMVGTFIMAGAAVAAAWLVRQGAEVGSQIIGGAGFLFGAMWFGAGLKQLRGK